MMRISTRSSATAGRIGLFKKMSDYAIKIENLNEFRQAIKDYPKKAEPRLITAINKTLAILQKSATPDVLQFRTPSTLRTHYLEASWGEPGRGLELARPGKLSGKIWSNARYAIFVHEGTRPHEIHVVAKQVLANKKTGQIFGTHVKHPGTKANKFLPRIIAKGQEEINIAFKNALTAILGDIAAAANTR